MDKEQEVKEEAYNASVKMLGAALEILNKSPE